MNVRYKNGFSLLELMVVISIISVLVTISVPALKRQHFKSKRTEAYLGLNTLQTLQESYIAEHEESVDFPDPVSGVFTAYGNVGNTPNCDSNILGFQMSGCAEGKLTYYYACNQGIGSNLAKYSCTARTFPPQTQYCMGTGAARNAPQDFLTVNQDNQPRFYSGCLTKTGTAGDCDYIKNCL